MAPGEAPHRHLKLALDKLRSSWREKFTVLAGALLALGYLGGAFSPFDRFLLDSTYALSSRPATNDLLADFTKLLESQVGKVAAALGGTQPAASVAPASTSFNAEAASDAAVRLKSLLDASDGDSEEAFASFSDALGGKIDQATLNGLGDSIRDFDFESAAARLEKIVNELGLNAGKATA